VHYSWNFSIGSLLFAVDFLEPKGLAVLLGWLWVMFRNRNAYMKTLDKPTSSLGGNLLNIKKNSIVPAKDLALVECSGCLASKTLFSCLTVSNQSGGLN
jgi:hypothetical protein